MPEPLTLKDLEAKSGERVLPKWKKMIQFIRSTDIVPGPGFRITRLPQGTIVTPIRQTFVWAHPWMVGSSFSPESKEVYVGDGTVNGAIPYVAKGGKLGSEDRVTGERKGVVVSPKTEGSSWIALGANFYGNDLNIAALSDDPSYDELRVQEISALPKNKGLGGVQADDEGWAWYPLARLDWGEDNEIVAVFQVVYHNLQHTVVAAGRQKNASRHFFFPA